MSTDTASTDGQRGDVVVGDDVGVPAERPHELGVAGRGHADDGADRRARTARWAKPMAVFDDADSTTTASVPK